MDLTDADRTGNSDGTSNWSRRSFLATVSSTTILGLAGCSSQSSPPTSSGSNQSTVERDEYQGDAFVGTITEKVGSSEPMEVEPGIYEGVIVYDRSCKPVGDGLTGCDAGIEQSKLGPVNFYYEHDMNEKPCLEPEQQVVFKVENEKTIVQRKR